MKVLVADDDATTRLLVTRALSGKGHEVAVALDGLAALKALGQGTVDAVLTDWMMPAVDGIELIRRIRATTRPVPPIVVFTALSAPEARNHAIAAGADDYLIKPCLPREVVDRLEACVARGHQPPPKPGPVRVAPVAGGARPPFAALSIAASTGGPSAVSSVLKGLGPLRGAAVFVVIHGPAWMLESYATRLDREGSMPVALASDHQPIEPGHVYVAPGDRHLRVGPAMTLRVQDGEPINFVKPAADPLFESAATVFGRHHVAAVLTGMGRDGTVGARSVAASGGLVVVQDPATAVATSMPQTVIDQGLAGEIVALDRLAAVLTACTQARGVGIAVPAGI